MTLKDIYSPSTMTTKPPAAEMVEKVEMFEKSYQYLYHDAENIYLQDSVTFEPFEIPVSLFLDTEAFRFVECNNALSLHLRA